MWNPYIFDMELVSNVESTLEPCLKRLIYGAVLTECQVLEVPVIFVEGDPMSLSEVQSPGTQFLETQNPSDL